MKGVYDQLIDAINNVNPLRKFFKIDEIYPVLELMFSLEEAEIGAKMQPGRNTAEQVAKRTNKDVKEVARILENMADNGVVYPSSSDDISTYRLLPLLPGSWEIQMMKGKVDEKSKRLARAFRSYLNVTDENPEMAALESTVPFSRVIPISESLSPETSILPYEVLDKYLEEVDFVSVSPCYCRHEAVLLGHPCDKPIETCFSFGPFARFLDEKGFGRLVDKTEAHKILKEAEEAGLVHCASNSSEQINFICNCCSCHCAIIQSMTAVDTVGLTSASSFIANLEEEECSSCGVCIDRCQVKALSMDEGVIDINSQLCIGCGLCVSTCPTEALTMVAREEKTTPPKNYKELAVAMFASMQK